MKFLQDYIIAISSNELNIYFIILALSFIVYIVTRYIVIKSISHFFKKTSTDLDDIPVSYTHLTLPTKRIV